MIFDIVVGNPPYQEGTGGGDGIEKAMPLYDKFINRSIRLGVRYISMIIQSRWVSGGQYILDGFRDKMIGSNKLVKVMHYERSSDVFNDVDIAGGVMVIVWDSEKEVKEVIVGVYDDNGYSELERDLSEYRYIDSHNREQYMVVLNNRMVGVIEKVRNKSKRFMSESVLQTSPFRLSSEYKDSDEATKEKCIKVICSRGRVTYTDIGSISQNSGVIEKYKVISGKVSPDMGIRVDDGGRRVINMLGIIGPREVCSLTYIVLGSYDSLLEAERLKLYMGTKFVRSLILVSMGSMNISGRNFIFVPEEDFSGRGDIDWGKSIEEIDKQLYKKYGLSDEEIGYIDKQIRYEEV